MQFFCFKFEFVVFFVIYKDVVAQSLSFDRTGQCIGLASWSVVYLFCLPGCIATGRRRFRLTRGSLYLKGLNYAAKEIVDIFLHEGRPT